MSKCRKLAKTEYKTRHNCVGKVIHLEKSKNMKLKFDPTKKWYMHNPARVLENEIHKLLGDLDLCSNLPLTQDLFWSEVVKALRVTSSRNKFV